LAAQEELAELRLPANEARRFVSRGSSGDVRLSVASSLLTTPYARHEPLADDTHFIQSLWYLREKEPGDGEGYIEIEKQSR